MVDPGYIQNLENALWDFFVNVGDREEDLVSGGTYRGQDYDPMEIPVSVVAKAIGFDLTAGLGFRRIEQLDAIGLYKLRRTGPGKPSFLSMLVWDKDEHFKTKADSRINFVIDRKAEELEVKEGLITLLDQYPSDQEAHDALASSLRGAGREREIPVYWRAYLSQREQKGGTPVQDRGTE